MTATEVADVLRATLRGESHPRANDLRKLIVSVKAQFGDGWDDAGSFAKLTLDMGWGHSITVTVSS